jgi:ribose 5-phosphate isomerase B
MIYIGSDHAGYELKEKLKIFLKELDYEVTDKGAFSLNKDDDYPDFVIPVALSVADEPNSLGVVLGGSGQGEAMSANKIDDIRATEYYGGDLEIVKISREHNDANILSLGARFITEEEAKNAVKLFIETKFSGDKRHIRRINKLDEE